MKYRDHYFKREATVNNSDTVMIDIGIKDPISQIAIEYEIDNGAASSLNHEIHDDIASIELVDGSAVLWSLDMEQARALNFFEMKQMPHALFTEAADAVQEEKCFINFGRFRDDPEYYLLPANYANLQLRITHTFTISSTVGFATGTGKITVMARIIEDGAKANKGYLSAKVKANYLSGTSGEKDIELPRDNPYRLIMLQGLKTLLRHDEVLSKHRLSIDADKYVPFNLFSEDIEDLNRSQFGFIRQKKELLSADDDSALFDIYNIHDAWARTTENDHLATVEAIDSESVRLGLYDLSTPGTPAFQTTAKAVHVTAEGLEPFGCLCLPFGNMQEPSDWLRAQDFGDIRLFSTQKAAGNCSVILQQLSV